MDDDEFDFEKLEEERKLKMNKLYGEIIKQRAMYNLTEEAPSGLEKAIDNYVEISKANYKEPGTTTNINNNYKDTRASCVVPNTKVITNTNQITNFNFKNTETNYVEPDTKTIGDINIPLTDFYLKNFVFQVDYLEIEKSIRLEKTSQSSENILKMKIEINKRLNQINNDPRKVEMIANILGQYSQSYAFVEIFTCKFLEQCIVQVSRNLESFRQLAFLFKMVFSKELLCFYKANLVKKMSSSLGIKGLYATYCGVLVELDLVDELWAFGAGLLNSEPSNDSYVVLEVFLMVGGGYLSQKVPQNYYKLLRCIKKYTLSKIEEPAIKFRIEEMIK